MLLSRFLQSAKPVWGRFPKAVAVLIPPIVSLIPQVVELLQQTKTWADLANYLVASAALVVVGLFPDHERVDPPPPGSSGLGGTSKYDRAYNDRKYPPDPPASF